MLEHAVGTAARDANYARKWKMLSKNPPSPGEGQGGSYCAAMILRRRVDANSKRLLTASEPINETPALRAIRFDPQSQRAAIGKRADSGAAPNSRPVSGMSASDLSAAAAYQQFSRTPTSGPGRPLTLTYCFSVISGRFRTPLDGDLVPLAGVEPALLAELDFEFERVYQFRHRGADRRGAGARRGY